MPSLGACPLQCACDSLNRCELQVREIPKMSRRAFQRTRATCRVTGCWKRTHARDVPTGQPTGSQSAREDVYVPMTVSALAMAVGRLGSAAGNSLRYAITAVPGDADGPTADNAPPRRERRIPELI